MKLRMLVGLHMNPWAICDASIRWNSYEHTAVMPSLMTFIELDI